MGQLDQLAAKLEILDQVRITDPPPELVEQWKWLNEELYKANPELGQQIWREVAALHQAQRSLRRVLAQRNLSLSPAQDARIDACGDLAEVERWVEQAVTAASTDEALT